MRWWLILGAGIGLGIAKAQLATPASPVPVLISIGPTNLSGPHLEYRNSKVTFGHMHPIAGVTVTFPTTSTNRYTVEVRPTLKPNIYYTNAFGELYGIDEPGWTEMSQTMLGNGGIRTVQFNCVYSNAFFRVRVE